MNNSLQSLFRILNSNTLKNVKSGISDDIIRIASNSSNSLTLQQLEDLVNGRKPIEPMKILLPPMEI